jgi:hypothetical protein
MDDQLLINQQTRVFPKIFGQTHVFLFGVQWLVTLGPWSPPWKSIRRYSGDV